VRVDDTRRSDQVPTVNTDWRNYGGITRPVSLVALPESFIQDYSIQLKKGSTEQVRGWVQLSGSPLQQSVSIRIPEAGIQKTFKADSLGRVEISFDANLQLWSPESPKLYAVEIASETDKVADRIGFRSIEVRGTDILLNGRPIFLRGISMHEEAPTRPGRAWSEDDARTLLGWAKELGCNFVRLAHYPYDEAMLRMADQLGVLVWEEVLVYWMIEWENPQTLHNAETQLKEMIARDHNRAALIIYSVGNETPIGDPRNRFIRQLIDDAHSADATRLVSAALQPTGAKRGDRTTLQDWTSPFNKPLIISEFGADALFGYHGDPQTRWTEEYQENLYEHQLAMLKHIAFLRGMSPWVLKDFRSPRRPLPRFEDYFNRKGLVSDHGERKKAFFVLQKFYHDVQVQQPK
jgi:beta-glucuronidase